MRPQPLMIVPNCRRILCWHRVVQQTRQQQQQRRRLYHHSSRKNDGRGSATTTTAGDRTDTHQSISISSTVPKMGRGVKVGQYATTTRTYTSDDVDTFGRLIRDFNPLHSSNSSFSTSGENWWENGEDLLELQASALQAAGLIQFQNGSEAHDESDAAVSTATATGPAKALVHGMFVSSIFSSIFASLAPGCVYVNQSLDFAAPVFVEDTVVGCIHIERIRDWTRRRKGGIVVECHTRVYKLLEDSQSQSQSHASNNNSYHEPNPVEAQLVVKGRANVWLPIGSTDSNDGQ